MLRSAYFHLLLAVVIYFIRFKTPSACCVTMLRALQNLVSMLILNPPFNIVRSDHHHARLVARRWR